MSNIEGFPHDEEQIEEPIIPPIAEAEPQAPELLTEAGADDGLDMQSQEITTEEKNEQPHVLKTLNGWKKKIGVALLFGASLVATGCNAEKPHIQRPESQKTEHRQTWSEYVKQYKKHNPSPWQTKHATPEEATQVREANGDSSGFTDNVKENVKQRVKQKKDQIKHMRQMKSDNTLHSQKTTSPEAEEFLK